MCAEYRKGWDEQSRVELGFTCDATLCTAKGRDLDLLDEAGSGLRGVAEIVRLETEGGCSCCASQICGCEPSPETNEMISDLNDEQRNRDIAPQCDLNGTLCGGP